MHTGSPGNSKRGSQAPFGRFNEGGSREGKGTSPPPVADEGLVPFPQRSKNRRNSVSPNGFSGTARRTETRNLSTLPQCHSRACFATARQHPRVPSLAAARQFTLWRGCGNCGLASSATWQRKAAIPLLSVVFFATFFWTSKRKWDRISSCARKKERILGKDALRSCWAGFVCISFPSRGMGKEIKVFARFLHRTMKRPPKDPFVQAGRFESPSGTRRFAPSLPPACGRAALVKAQQLQKKKPALTSWLFLLELLGRFELPTSSLPIHFRLSRLDFACLRLSPESRTNTRFSDSACPLLA